VFAVVVGLPLLFYFQLAMGFASSAGDYYKITDARLALISQRKLPDSLAYKLFEKVSKIDTARQIALYVFLSTDFYSSRSERGFELVAAREPGTKGCKEKILSISLEIIELRTEQSKDITAMAFMPDDMVTFSESTAFKSSKIRIKGEYSKDVMLFASMEDFKNEFNFSSAALNHLGLGDAPLLFYLPKQCFDKMDGSFKLLLKLNMSDGSLVLASLQGEV